MRKQQVASDHDAMLRHMHELVYNYLYGARAKKPGGFMMPGEEQQTEMQDTHAVAGGADGHED